MKWIFAIVGYSFYRFPGAILGFFVGSILEFFFKKTNAQQFTSRQRINAIDFELNLLSLCAILIKADGKITENELTYVRNYFISNYGKEKADTIFSVFNTQIKNNNQSLEKICGLFTMATPYATRLQIVYFLAGVAKADGHVSSTESQKLSQIAHLLRISSLDFESIKAMFVEQAGNAYKILEIERTASDEEVKKAYRNMVKKYHPDKLINVDEALKKGAIEKFREVQKAYEKIQKERGL